MTSDLNFNSFLLTQNLDITFTLHTLYNTQCTPCTIHTAHIVEEVSQKKIPISC